ncbi:glutamic-type intramembrane protease PrsW [Paenibacillus sp. MMS18-CY102]|uniref:glutamic-type intramembrane protease PrsW n=1 Tax=Paenibacillus sp. MMS18-CY102 TaxID=2682849 RepID=UPI0013662DDD|nr:glutamic-type intramembrane protease PrsW [Paenibacillus sp. MMS18-CY102]MWC28439.1 intramembrane metalloprotease PrsW [Paenibacillus sp. MMS18-CY102]
MLFSVLTGAIAPGVFLLTYLYLKDKYDTEPIHMVVRMFFIGVLILFPIMIVQRGVELWWGDHQFVTAFGLSALVEESVKWFVLYHIIYNHTEFDEPYDGIVYAASISLGFATLENVLYALMQPSGFGTLMFRALLPVSGHALFGITMGYYMGKAKFASAKRIKPYLLLSFILPIIFHGLYDWILLAFAHVWMWIIPPFMAFMWIWALRNMQRANNRSPFRLLPREDEVKL